MTLLDLDLPTDLDESLRPPRNLPCSYLLGGTTCDRTTAPGQRFCSAHRKQAWRRGGKHLMGPIGGQLETVPKCRKCGGKDFDLRRVGNLLRRVCAPCRERSNRGWRERNPEQVKAIVRAWNTANRDRMRAANRRWRARVRLVALGRRAVAADVRRREIGLGWVAVDSGVGHGGLRSRESTRMVAGADVMLTSTALSPAAAPLLPSGLGMASATIVRAAGLSAHRGEVPHAEGN